MRFACDAMLGRLGKWLKALGLDAYYAPNARRHTLLRVAREEKRHVLTRAQSFEQLKDIPPFTRIQSQNCEEQLVQVFTQWPELKNRIRPFSRCLHCNRPIRNLSKNEVIGRVPEKITGIFDDFYTCPACHKIFWKGGHVARLIRKLDGILCFSATEKKPA